MSESEIWIVHELRRMAKAGTDANTFSIAGERASIEVHYSPGSSSSLTLRASYDDVARADHEAITAGADAATYRRSGRGTLVGIRPLSITLRSETASDLVAKREGVNVEYQTGDPAFDRDVYVSTPTTDADILAAVLGPRVRQGVVALLRLGFQEVAIDEAHGKVQAFLTQFAERSPTPGRGKLAIDAFELVLSDLPRVSASSARHAPPPFWVGSAFLGLGAFAVLFTGIFGWLFALDSVQCSQGTEEPGVTSIRAGCGGPIALAFVTAVALGIAAAAILGPIVTPRLRGKAESAAQISRVRLATAWLVFVASLITLSVLFPQLFRG